MALVGTVRETGKSCVWSGISGTALNSIVLETENHTDDYYYYTLSSTAGETYVIVDFGSAEYTSVTRNLFLQSEDFGTTWAVVRSAINTDATTAPDGESTADRLIDDSGGGGQTTVLVKQDFTFTPSTTYTYSVYCKKDQLDWCWFGVFGLGALAISAFFDLDSGAVGATTGADNISEAIASADNGFFRCSLTFPSHATDTSGVCQVILADSNGDANVARDGTSSVFVWGAQLETNTFADTYVPTTTTQKSAALSLQDQGGVDFAVPVRVTVADRAYSFEGNFKSIRVLQAGSTNVANPILRAHKRKTP